MGHLHGRRLASNLQRKIILFGSHFLCSAREVGSRIGSRFVALNPQRRSFIRNSAYRLKPLQYAPYVRTRNNLAFFLTTLLGSFRCLSLKFSAYAAKCSNLKRIPSCVTKPLPN